MKESEINFIKINDIVKKKNFIKLKKNQIKNWCNDNNFEIDYLISNILLLINNNDIILNTSLDKFINEFIIFTNNNSF